MTRQTMRRRILENIGRLDSDGTTAINGKVTSDGIDNKINDLYREELFPLLSDKFPEDFMQVTYPISTYTATGTVSSSSTSTTLVSTTAIFSNTMEGFTVYNLTDDETAVIVTYSSSTQVTLDTTIGDTWDGDTIYILGNEYSFGGSTADLKEVYEVGIKYTSSDTEFTEMTRIDIRDARYNKDRFSKANPAYYLTSVDVNGTTTPALGIVPYPSAYNGKIQVTYTERPPAMGDSDEPVLNVPGISQVIIDGVSAWGHALLGNWQEHDRWLLRYEGNPNSPTPGGKIGLLRNYKPRTRGGPFTRRLSSFYTNGGRRYTR